MTSMSDGEDVSILEGVRHLEPNTALDIIVEPSPYRGDASFFLRCSRRPVRLAPFHGTDRVRPHHQAAKRNLRLEHARHRARQLRGDNHRPRVRARLAGGRRPARARGRRALPYRDPEERDFLVRVCPDAASRRDTLGDTLTKSHAEGGLGLGRITSSLVIAAFIIVGIIVTFRWERRASAEPDSDARRVR